MQNDRVDTVFRPSKGTGNACGIIYFDGQLCHYCAWLQLGSRQPGA